MTQGVDTTVPGYGFMPDPSLQPGNFIDPATIQEPGLQYHLFDVNSPASVDTGDQLDDGSFPATIDPYMWSQLTPRPDDTGVFDPTDFSDLIVFQQ